MKNAVSLLPAQYRQENATIQRLRALRQAMLGVMICLALAAGALLVWRMGLAGELRDLQGQNAQAQATILNLAPYERLANEKNALENRIAAVQKLDEGWLSAVFEVTRAFPRGVWLNAVTAESGEGGQRSLRIECGCNTYDDIARTLEALAGSDAVESAACLSSQESGGSVTFDLTVVLSGRGAKGGVAP